MLLLVQHISPPKAQVEGLQQSNARSSAALQSLRQQLTEVEGRGQSSSEGQAELQTEIGRLRSALKEKVGIVSGIYWEHEYSS